MKILTIDCSVPEDHPEREELRDLTPEEIEKNNALFAQETLPKEKTTEERLAELEAKISELTS